MLERIIFTAQHATPLGATTPQRKSFAATIRTGEEQRTAAAPRAWQPSVSAQGAITAKLETASAPQDFESALALSSGKENRQDPASAEQGYGLYDVLDVINPLQHIPVVNLLYRGITGDEMGAPARILGSSLYGGPVGAVMAVIDTVVEQETGRTMAGNAIALAGGDALVPKEQSASIDLFLPSSSTKEEERTKSITKRGAAEPPLATLPGTVIAKADLSAPRNFAATPKSINPYARLNG